MTATRKKTSRPKGHPLGKLKLYYVFFRIKPGFEESPLYEEQHVILARTKKRAYELTAGVYTEPKNRKLMRGRKLEVLRCMQITDTYGEKEVMSKIKHYTEQEARDLGYVMKHA